MEHIDVLISKYLAGEATNHEVEELKKWMEENESREKTFLRVKHFWDAHAMSNSISCNIVENVEHRIAESKKLKKNNQNLVLKNNSYGKSSSYKWTGWAATVILFLAFSLSYLFTIDSVKSDVIEEVAFVEREVEHGKKATFTLADGTQIKLNSGSAIRFPEKFEADKREVYFEGEAFFDVAPDKQRPFIIHTGDFTTTVLGTSFNVKAYPDQDNVNVAVATGKVKVSSEKINQSLLLSPEEAVICDKATKNIAKCPFEKNVLLWKDGKMAFEKTSFKEIVRELEKWYGVKFEVKRKLNVKEGFSGYFENESLENILESFSYAGDFNYRIEKEKVLIY